jgi:hypothetical protein
MSWAEDMSEGSTTRTDVLRASPPMFESRVLDALSRVHPIVPVIIFVPGVIVLTAWSLSNVSVAVTAALIVGGYAFWTLFEYWLHRIVFHFEPEDGLGARMHWIIHGVHHDHPNDPLGLCVRSPLPDIRGRLRTRDRRGILHRLSRVRHDALLPAPLPPARSSGQAPARAAHATPLPG